MRRGDGKLRLMKPSQTSSQMPIYHTKLRIKVQYLIKLEFYGMHRQKLKNL